MSRFTRFERPARPASPRRPMRPPCLPGDASFERETDNAETLSCDEEMLFHDDEVLDLDWLDEEEPQPEPGDFWCGEL